MAADIEKLGPRTGDVPAERPTGGLVRDAIDDARALIKLEVELAKNEVREEIAELKFAGIALGIAAVLAIVGVSMLALMLVLAISPTWACSLGVGLVLFMIAGVVGYIGWSALPKKPLERTKRRLQNDVQRLKERVA